METLRWVTLPHSKPSPGWTLRRSFWLGLWGLSPSDPAAPGTSALAFCPFFFRLQIAAAKLSFHLGLTVPPRWSSLSLRPFRGGERPLLQGWSSLTAID